MLLRRDGNPHKYKSLEEYSPKPTWQNFWASALFFANLLILHAVTGYCWYHYPEGHDSLFRLCQNYLIVLVVVLVSGMLSTMIILFFVRKVPSKFLHVAFIGEACFCFFFSAIFFLTKHYLQAVTILTFSSFGLFFYLCLKGDPLLTSRLLKAVIEIGKDFRGIFTFLPFVTCSVCIFTLFIHASAVLIIFLESPEEKLLRSFIMFGEIWTFNVFINTLQASAAGAFAAHYFLNGRGIDLMLAPSTSVSRTLSYTFGSICMGSLAESILQYGLVLITLYMTENSFLAVTMGLLVRSLSRLLEKFHHFVYTYVAISGKSYWESTKLTWNFISKYGADAMIQDGLISSFSYFILYLLMTMNMFIAAPILYYLKDIPPNAVIEYYVVSLSSLTVLVPYACLVVIEAGVSAIFVCFADDPHLLRKSNPALYRAILESRGYISNQFSH